MLAPKERRETISKRWMRAIQGGILAFGAPFGWLAISMLLGPTPESAVYVYMLVGTFITLSAFGYLRGRDEEKLEHMVLVDPLTGVFNRRFFWQKLEVACHQANHSGQPVGLLLFDLDNFKSINDTLGHPAGDEVLVATCRAMGRVLRLNEYLCRIGGDEFAILMEGSREAAHEVAERIEVSLAKSRRDHDPKRGMAPADVSCGIASASDETAQKLYELADAALYQAKRSHTRRA